MSENNANDLTTLKYLDLVSIDYLLMFVPREMTILPDLKIKEAMTKETMTVFVPSMMPRATIAPRARLNHIIC